MKICFAFLTRGKLNNELIWYNYLNNENDKEILIHCSDDAYFHYINKLTNNIYINEVPTKRGSLQKVQNFLLEKCKNLNCDKFIILSDSCIPIRSYDYLTNELNNNNSYICYSTPWDMNRFPNNNFNIDFMGNHQWCIIDKSHYDVFLNDETRLFFEDQVNFPEESYYSTIIKKQKLEDSVINRTTTYADWCRSKDGSPYFFEGDDDDLEYINIALEKNNIFFRKIKDNIDGYFYEKIIKLIKI